MRTLTNTAPRSLDRDPASVTARPAGPLLLFDGLCNLCDAAVLFVIDRDPTGRVRFASLQSPAAAAALAPFGVAAPASGADPDSILLVDDGRLYDRSGAALRIAGYLTRPWPLLRVLRFIPRPLRDAVYRVIARNRFRWFGRRDSCRLPSPELRARFLD